MGRLGRVVIASFALLAFAGPSPATAAPSPERAEQLARKAYDYGMPLLEFLRVRHEQTSVACPDGHGNSPVNSFSNARIFADARARTVVAPNTDTLYSIAHLDLGKGPLVLGHPDMGKRYFEFQFLDPYTNVIDYVGTRTTGGKADRHVISWRGAPEPRPEGVPVIHSKFRRVWIIGRTLATNEADQRKAYALMGKYRLSRAGKGPLEFPADCDPGEPSQHPVPTGGRSFVKALGKATATNPPPKRDRGFLAKLKGIGIGPGLSPDDAGLPPDVLDAVYGGVADEAAELPGRVRLEAFQDSVAAGGWLQIIDGIGDYGTDYGLRATLAVIGLGANTAEEAVYPTAITDANGALLSGGTDYRMVIGPGEEPPAKYFWSVTMYDGTGFLVDNPIDRYSIGPTHPPLVRQPDGSIVIAISQDEPSEADVNWLPAPPGNFRLSMRIYGPGKSVLAGDYSPPPITPVGCRAGAGRC